MFGVRCPLTNPQELRDPVISATLSVYTKVASQLLPTPTRSHYTFNLRDISRVMQVRQQWRRTVQSAMPCAMTHSMCGCETLDAFQPP